MYNGVDDLLAIEGPDTVLDLIDRAEAPKVNERQSQAAALVDLAAPVKLHHTEDDKAWASFPVRGHMETAFVRSGGLRRFLLREFHEIHHKPPGAQSMQDAIGVLEARAILDGTLEPLHVRVAESDGSIYIDLGDAEWHVIQIDAHGWCFPEQSPVYFRRPGGMRALPTPVRSGSIDLLRSHINVGSDANWALFLGWLLAAFRPTGPYPILILQGEQGSAKSTFAKLVRTIIDPSKAPVRSAPRDERDLIIAATNSWVISYDNLSGLPHWLSDALCRLATGGGFSTRELYTNSDEQIFEAARPIILNGIDHLADRPDLADRAVVLHLPTIKENERKDEARVLREFSRDLPYILGSIFDALSAALTRRPHVHCDRLPRMADFALWAVAGEQALGFPPGTFMAAYAGNRLDSVVESVESDPLANSIVKLVEASAPHDWHGTRFELQTQLDGLVDDRIKQSKNWPKTPRGLSNKILRLKTFLKVVGIEVIFHERGAQGKRMVTIARVVPDFNGTSVTSFNVPSSNPSDPSVEEMEMGDDGHTKVTNLVKEKSTSSPNLAKLNALRNGRLPTKTGVGATGDGQLPEDSKSNSNEEILELEI